MLRRDMSRKFKSIPVSVIVDSCPRKGAVSFEECRKCQFFQGVEGLWPDVKVKCRYWNGLRELKVSLLVPCPLKKKSINFKTCLKCPLHRGFYGFHNSSPVVYCSLHGEPEPKARGIAAGGLLCIYALG